MSRFCITLIPLGLRAPIPCGGLHLSGSMAGTPKKNKLLTVKFHASELEELRAAAEQRQQPVSVMVRQALRAAGVPIAA